MTPLCFIDTETTGLHVDRQVWEIGIIRRNGGHEHEVGFTVDVDLSNADPFGLAVGRFYERHPRGRYLSGNDTEAVPAAYSRAVAALGDARWAMRMYDAITGIEAAQS